MNYFPFQRIYNQGQGIWACHINMDAQPHCNHDSLKMTIQWIDESPWLA
jgi:hypothetical protein